MANMELTEEEARVVRDMRATRERERLEMERESARRKTYPVTIRETDGIRVTKECDSKHTPWGVYDRGSLVCFCLYHKGALALADYILANIKGRRAA